jgi:hypothetical protein
MSSVHGGIVASAAGFASRVLDIRLISLWIGETAGGLPRQSLLSLFGPSQLVDNPSRISVFSIFQLLAVGGSRETAALGQRRGYDVEPNLVERLT